MQTEMRHSWERLSDELDNFREIARPFNPTPGEVPQMAGVEISGLSLPFGETISGDHILYIDFKRRYDLDLRIAEADDAGKQEISAKLHSLRQRAGILVADVAGHRTTDAVIGAILHQAFLLGVYYELDLFGEVTTRIFEHINTRFFRTTAVNRYFTMIYGEILEQGRFRFISAGHPPPAVFSREFSRFVPINPERLVSFPPVGMLPSSQDPDERIHPSRYRHKQRYAVNEIDLLSAGDILLLYSDGLADHDQGRFFPDAVERILAESSDSSAEAICARLRRELLQRAEPEDDISVVVIRKTP